MLKEMGAEMRGEGASGTRAQNSAQRHFKLLIPEISEWCEAIRAAAAKTTRKPPSGSGSDASMPAPQVINNFYADSHPRPITPKESEAAADGHWHQCLFPTLQGIVFG